MTNSLSNLVNNFSQEIHRIKCKFCHDDKKRETCGIKVSIVTAFLNTQIVKIVSRNTFDE